MCGIAGYVSDTGLAGDAMVQALHHRGPDASGTYACEAHRRQVFLGHARLSIIDLSDAGRQPMTTPDGRIVLVFNGEIYNFQALRSRYCQAYPFRSATDTEVVLAMYDLMGLACLDHIHGDFAMAILDLRRGELLLVRDRVGVKPLYFSRHGSSLLFGSEIKALIAAGMTPVLAREYLQKFLVFKYVPGNDTLFRGVCRVPPGHILRYELGSGEISLEQFWSPTWSADRKIGYAEAKAGIADLVSTATRDRLVADVPIGNFLSGGLDSSIIAFQVRDNPNIAHYCARQSASDVAHEGTSSDYEYASRLASEWHLPFSPVDIGGAELSLDQVQQTAWYCDDLIADSAQIPAYLITKGAAAGARVFLSGMGADELFLGYAGHILALLDRYLERSPGGQLIRTAFSRLDQGRGRFKSARRYLYRLGKYQHRPARFGLYSVVGDVENALAVAGGGGDAVFDYVGRYFPPGSDPFEGFKRFEFENFLQKNLAYTDRMAMANAVEVRVPFLDHRIVDLAYALPTNYKLGAFGRSKRILKDTFGHVLPGYVTRRRKAGFGMPIRSVFRSEAHVTGLLDMPLLRDAGGLDDSAIRRVVAAHATGQEDNSALIYALLSFQEWYKRFFVRKAYEAARPTIA